MHDSFSLAQFNALYPNDQACFEEIIRQKFPEGIYCTSCKKTTRHYRIRQRNAYSCKICRRQISPLSNTLFEKSTTPLKQWFFALFLMIQTRGNISCKQLERELGITYKTAWRIHNSIKKLMEQNDADLLKDPEIEQYKERKWLFFNKLEIKVVQKQEPSKDDEDFSVD
jgi:transposase